MKKITLFLIALVAHYSFGQPPSNDECDGATGLTVNADQACSVVVSGTTLGGTASPQDAEEVSGTPTNDVWYSFVATGDRHRIVLSNVEALEGGDDTDLGMAVYSGSCEALTFVETSDPNTLNLTELAMGVTYYVRVYGWYEETNPMSFDICIGSPPPPGEAPVNDECSGATALTVNADQLCGSFTSGSTLGGTASSQDAEEVSGTPTNDVWYSFVATGDRHRIVISNVEALEDGFDTDMGMAVYSGTCESLSFVDTSDPNTLNLTDLAVGVTYYVRVYGWYEETNPMSFDICVGTPLPPADPPVNDECEGAIALTVNADQMCAESTSGTTLGGTPSSQDPEEVSGTPNNDVWYTFVATGDRHRVSLSNIENLDDEFSEDMGIAVYAGDCNNLSFLETSDPETLNLVDLIAGETYYVRVYGWSSVASPMSFDICIGTPLPPADPPVNDECDGAIALTVGPDACANPTSATTLGGTPSPQDSEEVSGTPNNDVWFTFVATTDQHTISMGNIVNLDDEFSTDMGIAVYSGNCSSLVFFDTSDPETIALTDLDAGETYYVRVYGWSRESSPMSFDICVGTAGEIPANDSCFDAIVATVPYSNSQDATAATENSGPISCEDNEMNDGVWYTFVGNGSDITVSIAPFAWDPELGIYQGDCDTLQCVASVDNGGTGRPETFTISPTELGVSYYVNVGHYSSDDLPEGPFQITISPALSTPGFDNDNFRAYPNPVENVLNLDYTQNISNVAIFNLVGQQVFSKSINADKYQVDMSNLSAGAYIVKVTADNQIKTLKVIKR